MTDQEFREQVQANLSKHVAAGKPVLMGSNLSGQIGDVIELWCQRSGLGHVFIQRVRIVRLATHAEYLAASMPPTPDGRKAYDPDSGGPNLYYYEVEGD